MNRQAKNHCIIPLVLSLLPLSLANISARAQADEKNRVVNAVRFEQPPVIDGRLDEAVWRQAGVLKDFYQTEPGDNVKASHPTEVRLGYDAKFLYVGIHAIDEPAQVRATVAKRDDLSGNDYVAVWLDTFNDRRRAYVLGIERFIDKNAYVGILRLKRDVGRESSVGMIAASYNFIEKHNQLFGVDGRFTFTPHPSSANGATFKPDAGG